MDIDGAFGVFSWHFHGFVFVFVVIFGFDRMGLSPQKDRTL
jgi:hypothetical protein